MGTEQHESAADCTGSAQDAPSIPDLLTEMTDYCDRADDSRYGTLSTNLVRDFIRRINAVMAEEQSK